jgi:hypothetical protein
MIRRLGFSLLLLLAVSTASAQSQTPTQLLVDVVQKKTSIQVDGLSAANFRVTVDGKAAKVIEAERRELRSNVVVLLDRNGSMFDKWNPAIDATERVIQSLLPHTDVSLLPFNERESPSPVISAGESLASLEEMRKPVNGEAPTKGRTALWDAMYSAIDSHELRQNDVLVLVTDGGDNNSRHNLSNIQKLIAERGIRVFVLYLSGSVIVTPEEHMGPMMLQDLASLSGDMSVVLELTTIKDRLDFSQKSQKQLSDLGPYITRRALYPYVLTVDFARNQTGKLHIDLTGVDEKRTELVTAKRRVQ